MQSEIINILPDLENYEIGFADLGDLVRKYYPYRYAVVIGKKLDDAVIDGIHEGPTPVYYDLYRRTNDELNLLTAKIERFLTQNGIPCLQIKSTVQQEEIPEEFSRTLRLNFSHKMAATRAGLGWIGKTDLLISRRFGPRVRLVTVLTNFPFENPGKPIRKSRCGTCDLCVVACPGRAAGGRLWNDQLDRDAFFDAFKCRDACRKISIEKLDRKIHICGICISVCPVGNKNRP